MPIVFNNQIASKLKKGREEREGESAEIPGTWKLVLISVLPILGLIVQNIVLLASEIKQLTTYSSIREDIEFSSNIGSVVHHLQLERTATVVFSSNPSDLFQFAKLTNMHVQTEASFTQFFRIGSPPERSVLVQTIHADVKAFRMDVLGQLKTNHDAIVFYTKLNRDMLTWMEASIGLDERDETWRSVVAYYMFVLGKEMTELFAALGVTYFSAGVLPLEEYANWVSAYSKAEVYIQKSIQFSDIAAQKLQVEFNNTGLDLAIKEYVQEIHQNNGTNSTVKSERWLSNMTTYAYILRDVETLVYNNVVTTLEDKLSGAKEAVALCTLLLITALLLLPAVFYLVSKLSTTIQAYANTLKVKTLDLKRERKKTEKLLHEILPVAVAEKLMKNETIKPQHFDSVTIYFSDVVGFTTISSNSTPIQVVNMLNEMYNTFDERLELYDVYKVETIGDAYMVASGLPEKNGEAHSAEMALTALDLNKTVSRIAIPHMKEVTLRLRIGLNTGPTVAGVVGLKMPRYCLFGDAVNTASRMESTGLPDQIQISPATYQALHDNHVGFYFEERGPIEVKGKGTMNTYFLTGKDDKLQPDR